MEEVWRRASSASRLSRLVIATDDRRILEAASGFGAEALLTGAGHASGTDRVAEAAERLGAGYGTILNIQGDEPLITGSCLDHLIQAMVEGAQMATLSEPIEDAVELFDPNVVKVVRAGDGRALYFSRSPIPYYRGGAPTLSTDFRKALATRPRGLAGYRKHQGIYAYTRETLLALTRLAVSPLEVDEGLEQLRALGAGYSIQVVDSDFRSLAVDTPADLERVSRALSRAEAG